MKIILTSHGDLCQGMLSTLKMFASVDEVCAVSLDDRGIESFSERFTQLVDTSDECLIITDIEGGSPYQTALRLKLENDKKIEILSGMNLPMVIEAVLGVNYNTIEQLRDKALDSGKQGINTFVNKVNINEDDE